MKRSNDGKSRNNKGERIEGAWEAALQPWFLPKPLAWKIRSMLPHEYRRKMRYYFDDFGCIKCGRKTARYGFNGFCRVCCELVMHRMAFAFGRRQKVGVKREYSKQQLQRVALARELLRDLR
jgi:hypothetical protein